MYLLNSCRTNHASVLLFFLSLTLAQDTAPQSIYSLDVYSAQKPCAQVCFVSNFAGCQEDNVAAAIGCQYNYCSANVGAPNNCYCRADLQSVAEAYLTSCVKNRCSVGDSSIDISSAGSIYENYCSSKGFPVNVPATTTPPAGAQATTTVYVTVYSSSGLPSSRLAHSMVWNVWGLCFFLSVYISDVF
jgi:hypothetical protein